jgi:hypothetical protein
MQREMLESGRFRIFEMAESGQKDISNQHVEQITANIAEFDRTVAEYEATSRWSNRTLWRPAAEKRQGTKSRRRVVLRTL